MFEMVLDSIASILVLAMLVWGGVLMGQDNVVRVSESDAKKAAVTRVNPQYPAMAKQLRLSGVVEVDVTIDSGGAVEKAQLATGNPILGNAAVSAVKGWKFKPFTVGGTPSKAVTTLAFNFSL